MNKFSYLLLILSLISVSVCNKIDLFHYTNPSHNEQVAYIVNVAEYLMMKHRWEKKFDSKSCPEFSTHVCPVGKTCRPPTEPPLAPLNICDLPEHLVDSKCASGGECHKRGTCPVNLCEVPLELRVKVDGAFKCGIEHCELKVNKDTAACRPVNRCDLKLYEGHLDNECKPPTDKDRCLLNPNLCPNICDVTGDYSTCTYSLCYSFPHLPHCNDLPPPVPCTAENMSNVDRQCCNGAECYTGFDKCLWGYSVGSRLIETMSATKSNNGQPLVENVYSCVNELEIKYKQNLIFECFQDGVIKNGMTQIKAADMASIVTANKDDDDKVTATGSIADKKIDVEIDGTTTVAISTDSETKETTVETK